MKFISEYFERRRVRKTFERSVSPGLLRLLESGPPKTYFPKDPERKHFQFVIVLIDESKPEEVSALLGKVTEAFFRHGMFLDQIFFSLVTAHAGHPFEHGNNPESRLAVINDIIRENPGRVRIAHGECNGLIGNFGCDKRFSWGALIPNFLDILRKLMDAPRAAVIEIPKAKANDSEAARRF
jgi:hypothetical protein